ncbi:hypothetical protein IW261DRAFT_1597666 [Armillaria novae-zelandiae]|uniref:Uncharacterized protein n=1 Tax=Armillaria novae-zelandiae TaxID=153914 RepID=A0AA39U532_9AGAR|nr:hypothetical protein IW261DRAFT_1597666 [Armillaria novae-zelandiae]
MIFLPPRTHSGGVNTTKSCSLRRDSLVGRPPDECHSCLDTRKDHNIAPVSRRWISFEESGDLRLCAQKPRRRMRYLRQYPIVAVGSLPAQKILPPGFFERPRSHLALRKMFFLSMGHASWVNESFVRIEAYGRRPSTGLYQIHSILSPDGTEGPANRHSAKRTSYEKASRFERNGMSMMACTTHALDLVHGFESKDTVIHAIHACDINQRKGMDEGLLELEVRRFDRVRGWVFINILVLIIDNDRVNSGLPSQVCSFLPFSSVTDAFLSSNKPESLSEQRAVVGQKNCNPQRERENVAEDTGPFLQGTSVMEIGVSLTVRC